jgi:hypothetical protein
MDGHKVKNSNSLGPDGLKLKLKSKRPSKLLKKSIDIQLRFLNDTSGNDILG